MTKAEAMEALTPIFREVFDDDSIELTDELKHSPEQLYQYALHILDFFLHERKR